MSKGTGKDRDISKVPFCSTSQDGCNWVRGRKSQRKGKRAGCVSHMTKEIGHMVFQQEKTCRLNKNVNTGGIWSMGGGNKELCESSEEKKLGVALMWSRFSTVAGCHLLWVPQDDGKDRRKTLLTEGQPRRRGALGVFKLKTTSLSVSRVVNSACSPQCRGVASVTGRAPLWTGLLVAQSWGEPRATAAWAFGWAPLPMGFSSIWVSCWIFTASEEGHIATAALPWRGREEADTGADSTLAMESHCGGSFIFTQMGIY